MSRGWRGLVAGLFLTGSACARHHGAAADEAAGAVPAPGHVWVHVINHYKVTLEIYAIGASTTHRLGLVYPGTVRDFELPQVLTDIGSVDLMAVPSGTGPTGPTIRPGEIRILPGDIVDFEIATNVIGSRVNVRLEPPPREPDQPAGAASERPSSL